MYTVGKSGKEVSVGMVDNEMLEAIRMVLFPIEERLEVLESNMNRRFDEVEQNLNSRIDEVERNLNSRIDEVEHRALSRIDYVYEHLKDSITETENALGTWIKDIDMEIQREITPKLYEIYQFYLQSDYKTALGGL